jgi:hypothetical protein
LLLSSAGYAASYDGIRRSGMMRISFWRGEGSKSKIRRKIRIKRKSRRKSKIKRKRP